MMQLISLMSQNGIKNGLMYFVDWTHGLDLGKLLGTQLQAGNLNSEKLI